jgi:cell division cycle 20-like protein 1 (cofactor of APC complex)
MAATSEIAFINPKTAEISPSAICERDSLCLKFDSAADQIAVGTDHGSLSSYAVDSRRRVWTQGVSDSSVLCCAWSGSAVLSGSRDGTFGVVDTRSTDTRLFPGRHRDELCGLALQRESPVFATSSNDATVKIWDLRRLESPLRVYDQHCAAVRALSCSPSARDVLASGGGTSDRMIRICNVSSGETIASVDARSQVCNVFWNGEHNEIVSTHGFSLHQIALWRAADLSLVVQFYEHSQRVLFMAHAPDGSRIATATPPNEFLIWKMFTPARMSPAESMLLLR